MNGTDVIPHGQLRDLVGDFQLPGANLVERDLEARDIDPVGREACLLALADAHALDGGDLDMRLWLVGRLNRDILDRQRPTRQIERPLAVARLAAAGADVREG